MLNPHDQETGMPLRSALHDWHIAHQAQFGRFAGQELVARYPDQAGAAQIPPGLGFVDLSLWPRLGYRGPGAAAWLGQHVVLPAQVNTSTVSASGDIILQLSATEYWLVGSLGDEQASLSLLQALRRQPPPTGVYSLPREHSHGLLAICGQHAPAALAKLCAIDLRPARFENGAMAQTFMADVGVVLVRLGVSTQPVFLVFCDASLTLHLWESFRMAGQEFQGRALGYPALANALNEAPDAPS
jgi:sarcosine oxidase subunit gamma